MKRFFNVLLSLVIVCAYVIILPTGPKASAASAKMETAIQWAIGIANDNSHGYSQSNRWGPDYDCSSFVISALKNAGYNVGSATYTGNMKSNLIAHGFTWIPWSQVGSVGNLRRGDILLNEGSHTELYIGNNQNVAASSNRGNTQSGDQDGTEIWVRSYWYDNWDGVLRESNPVVDLGTDFYAYIINTSSWKHLTNDGNNVSVRTLTGEANQVWKFDRESDGSYKITNCKDQLILDDQDFGNANGANVIVSESNDSTAQRWCISGESGAYYLNPKCSDLVLDVYGGYSEDGTNIQLWTKNYGEAQKFQIWKLDKPGQATITYTAGTTAVPTKVSWSKTANTNLYDLKIWNGTYWEGEPYKVVWDITGTSCSVDLPAGYYEAYLDSRNNYSCTMSNVIKFTVGDAQPVDVGDKFYANLTTVVNSLNITNNDGDVTVRKQDDNAANQVWYFEKEYDNSYTIKNCADNKYLDVYNSEDTDGTTVQTYIYNGGANQKWYIYGMQSCYYLSPVCAVRVLDVNGGKNNPGDKLNLWSLNYTNGQKFTINKLINYVIPDAVTSFKGTATNNSVKLTWAKNSTADSYKIKQLVNGKWKELTKTANNATTSYTVSGLKPNTEYQFAIYAFKGTQFSAAKKVTVKTTTAKPSAVTGFKGMSTSNSIKLTWTKNTGADSYKIKQLVNGKWKELTKTSSNATTSYTVNGLKPNTEYQFAIYAFKGTQFSAAKKVTVKTTAAKPAAVTDFKGTPTSNSVKLTWTKNTGADSYKIKQLVNGKWKELTKTASNATTSYTVSGLKANTEYQFAIYAFKGTQFSAATKVTVKTTSAKPTAVTSFKGTPTSNSVKLTWTKNTGADSYKIKQLVNGSWKELTKTSSNATTSYTVSGLKADTEYQFAIYAFKGTQFSAAKKITVKTTTAKPSAVTEFSGAVAQNYIVLSWNKNSTADSYKIKQLVNGKWKDVVKTADNSVTSYTVTGLKADTEYQFAIYAFKGTQFSTAKKLNIRTLG